jgi:hypothetical protein
MAQALAKPTEGNPHPDVRPSSPRTPMPPFLAGGGGVRLLAL